VLRFAPKPYQAMLLRRAMHLLQPQPGERIGDLFCGLGNPEAFRTTVENLGARVRDVRWFPDHHRYSQNDIAELSRWVAASGAELALTTQKDSVKLPVESLGARPLLALRIGMVFERGEAEFQEMLDAAVRPRPND